MVNLQHKWSQPKPDGFVEVIREGIGTDLLLVFSDLLDSLHSMVAPGTPRPQDSGKNTGWVFFFSCHEKWKSEVAVVAGLLVQPTGSSNHGTQQEAQVGVLHYIDMIWWQHDDS